MDDECQPGKATGSRTPLRIATIGLSLQAVFHLESAAIRDELLPVAAARTDNSTKTTEPVPGCSVCEIDELIERTDVDAVFVCGPIENRVDLAIRLLQSGKHVLIESAASFQPEHLQRLISEAENRQKLCEIWRPYDAAPDFRRASQVVSSGEIGPVRSLRFVQHDMAAALIVQTESGVSRDRLTNSTLGDLAAHRIAQALALVDSPARDVTASFRKDALVLGERDLVRHVAPEGDTSFHAVIHFENDATAIVDIGLACPAPYSTGWIVQGNQGGYHSTRQYITVDDGEIYDVAVDVEPFDPYLNLHSVLSNWPTPELHKNCQDRLRAELALAQLLQNFPQAR